MTSHQATLDFFLNGHIPRGVSQVHVSQSRGQAIGRLSHYLSFCKEQGADDNAASLIVSLIGELTNNCFDHNLGYWLDVPGCCVSWSAANNVLTFFIADRGRGIVETLRPVAGEKLAPEEVLRIAFEKVITGRAPENRGNGLKYVRRMILSGSHALKCFSNGVIYNIGGVESPVLQDLTPASKAGTLICFQWRI